MMTSNVGAGTRPGVRQLAARTPDTRERQVDALRAVAITAVVVGHWLLVAFYHNRQGQLVGDSALRDLSWAHPVTWLFQVMPIFFMVGGFANAASLVAHRDRGGSAAGWLLDRGTRLLRPTAVLLLALAAGALLARQLGADPAQIGRAAWLIALPLWFLVAYLAMVALTPLMHALHRRAGLAVPLLLLLPVLAGDLLRFRFGPEEWGYGNFAFAWLAIHQVGFAWRDGRFGAGPRVGAPLLGCGLMALVLLTTVGPYPVSMVTVPGDTFQNSSPPSLALVALATAQLGLALLLRPASERWLRRRTPWTVVVAANSVILTLFLWHMAAVVVAALALDTFGLLPTPEVGSAAWLWGRLPWLLLLAAVLAGLVAVFGRVEAAAARARRPVPGGGPVLLAATAAGYLAAAAGLLWAVSPGPGDHGPFGLATGGMLLFLAGAGLLTALPLGARAIASNRAARVRRPIRRG